MFGLAWEVSLSAEAQLVVVCIKVPFDFELDLVCLPLKHIDMIFGVFEVRGGACQAFKSCVASLEGEVVVR